MLIENIFQITELEHRKHTIQASLRINRNCNIFLGHFPGQPVLPGACMLQIIGEVLQRALKISFRLKKADFIKFLKIINPEDQEYFQMTLKYQLTGENDADVSATMTSQNDIFLKFKGLYIAK